MARYELRLPEMGESVAEATITNWLKNVGDRIEEDDAVVEVATDKVDSEVPSEVSGVIKEILFEENSVVQVGEVMAIIETDEKNTNDTVDNSIEEAANSIQSSISQVQNSTTSSYIPPKEEVKEDTRVYSPLVKSIAKAEGISDNELASIEGSGADGRITKYDMLDYLKSRKVTEKSVQQTPSSNETPFATDASKSFSSETEQTSSNESKNLTENPIIESIESSESMVSEEEKDDDYYMKQFYSGDVQNIAKENNVTLRELNKIFGTGEYGEVTVNDVEMFLEIRELSAANTPKETRENQEEEQVSEITSSTQWNDAPQENVALDDVLSGSTGKTQEFANQNENESEETTPDFHNPFAIDDDTNKETQVEEKEETAFAFSSLTSEMPNESNPFEKVKEETKFEMSNGSNPFEKAEEETKFEISNESNPFERVEKEATPEISNESNPFEKVEEETKFEMSNESNPFERVKKEATPEISNESNPFEKVEEEVTFENFEQTQESEDNSTEKTTSTFYSSSFASEEVSVEKESETVDKPVEQTFVSEKQEVAEESKKEVKEEAFVASKSGSQSSPKLKDGEELIPMSRMGKLISEHMTRSKQTSAHVQSFTEADVTRIWNWRNRVKGKFESREKQKFTFTPIFLSAVAKALQDYPMMNISVEGDNIIKKENINIGMATALPDGNLIVPVIKNADRLSLTEMAKVVNDLANRARNNQLKPDEVQNGTYTVTNIGSFGNVFGTPIINQPQVGILALGAIRKVPAVVETPTGDAIAIRYKMMLSHSYDHRVVNGALGGMFVQRVAEYLEQWDSEREV